VRLLTIAVTLSAVLCSASPALATTTVLRGSDPTKQVLKGNIVTVDGSVLNGEVVVEGDSITCVAADCTDPAGASIYTVTDAFIYRVHRRAQSRRVQLPVALIRSRGQVS
jgi:hypothetical protein